MLAVGIFAMGVIALGWSVNNCLTALSAKKDDQRARMALENRMAEIEMGSVQVAEPKTEELKGFFSRITLKQSRKPLELQNEKKEPLSGLFQVTLEASWENGDEPQTKTVTFFMFSAQ